MKAKKSPSLELDTMMPLLIGVWRRFHKLSGPSDVLQTREFRSVVNAVHTLHQGLELGKNLAGKDYFSDPEILGAYFLYYWVVHYQQGLSLINEIPLAPKRVLDICGGGSPFGFAALRYGANEVVALDRNTKALNLGAEICGRQGYPLSIRTHDCRKYSFPVEGKFDLVIVGHCLEELFPDGEKNYVQNQKKWIDHLLTFLSPDGYLLIVESSLLPTNRRVLTLREQLVREGVAVQAPCVWRGECPSLQTSNSPCYAQREFEKPYLIKEIQRAAQINLNSLKMTYLLMRSPEASWPELPDYPVHRVISPPIASDIGKRFYLCGTTGKISISSNLTQYPPEVRAFEYLKRGELISTEGAVERQNRFEIALGSRIRVEAAIGKALPEKE